MLLCVFVFMCMVLKVFIFIFDGFFDGKSSKKQQKCTVDKKISKKPGDINHIFRGFWSKIC